MVILGIIAVIWMAGYFGLFSFLADLYSEIEDKILEFWDGKEK